MLSIVTSVTTPSHTDMNLNVYTSSIVTAETAMVGSNLAGSVGVKKVQEDNSEEWENSEELCILHIMMHAL